ncbi:MAG TPA: ethanolamine ammonia-lyase subunit EutC [Bryobacteraceae bacterium]|jgi:ethanolamine ammonia-lyase small subunit|nr:ethanolamine ammonia-lyase subunit EutC [Bryobacteraceae bacterium]
MKRLGDYTPARVSLGLTGQSMPLKPLLDLRLAHARARDAVHFPLDVRSLLAGIETHNWTALLVHSAARHREEYLRRPDLGRRLDDISIQRLHAAREAPLTFVVGDGLSALAVHRHAVHLLERLLRTFNPDEFGPIVIAEQARVALADSIGELLGAELSVILIGERPGLSAPDSLGAYVTWQPRIGRTDAERNCVSNIHPQGLTYDQAAYKLAFLITESRRRKLSGVALKETAGSLLA